MTKSDTKNLFISCASILLLGTLLTDFLSSKTQRLILNGRHSSWVEIKTVIPQASILGGLLFFLYINDLKENLLSNPKLYAGDTSFISLFSFFIYGAVLSNSHLKDNLSKINDQAYKWKMSFNHTVQNPPMKSSSVEKI